MLNKNRKLQKNKTKCTCLCVRENIVQMQQNNEEIYNNAAQFTRIMCEICMRRHLICGYLIVIMPPIHRYAIDLNEEVQTKQFCLKTHYLMVLKTIKICSMLGRNVFCVHLLHLCCMLVQFTFLSNNKVKGLLKK